MAFDHNKFNDTLNRLSVSFFARADNVAYPPRKACAVCGVPIGSPQTTGFFAPLSMSVVATGQPCPGNRHNATANVPMTPSGQNHWATCKIVPNQSPTLNIVAASGINPPTAANIWKKVGPVGSVN